MKSEEFETDMRITGQVTNLVNVRMDDIIGITAQKLYKLDTYHRSLQRVEIFEIEFLAYDVTLIGENEAICRKT